MPAQVKDVILTHLHYDHVGNFHRFPMPRSSICKSRKSIIAMGRYMRYQKLGAFVRGGRCRRHRAAELRPPRAICTTDRSSCCPASRCIRRTGIRRDYSSCACTPSAAGSMVASDVTHFYENMESGRPFTTAFNVGEMLEGLRQAGALAAHPPAHRSGSRSAGHGALSGAEFGIGRHRGAA